MFDNLVADTRRLRELKVRPAPWYVLESLLFENGYQAVVLHRLAHWFRRRSVPVLPALLHRFSIACTGVDIAPAAEIGPGLLISHGVGLVIGNRVTVGANASLLHGATIGGSSPKRRAEMPVLGDDIFVGANACVVGAIQVGDGCFIGANAVVSVDLAAGCTALAPPPAVCTRPRAGASRASEPAG